MFNILKKRDSKSLSKSSKDEETMLSLLKSCDIDNEGIIMTKDGQFQRFLRVNTTDLYSLDRNDLAKYLDAFQLFNRVLKDDYKLVSLASKVSTSNNQVYWRRLGSKNPIRTEQDILKRKIQNENLAALMDIERQPDTYKELLFYIIIYSDNKKTLQQLTRNVQNADGGFLKLRPISRQETIEAKFKLNNMNSK